MTHSPGFCGDHVLVVHTFASMARSLCVLANSNKKKHTYYTHTREAKGCAYAHTTEAKGCVAVPVKVSRTSTIIRQQHLLWNPLQAGLNI